MKIRVIDPTQRQKTLQQLLDGDWFIRWAQPRSVDSCAVYMKLYDHSRLHEYGSRGATEPCVALSTGRICNMRPDQKVVQVKDSIEVELLI